MQHLDEGTIHSWLDGALSADEAARAEAHVAECPQCAAAVAEARGFVAASSRILTALDNAPRGVIPVAAPRKRVDPLVLRVAATVLVVAAGTLVMVQNRESTEPLKAIAENQATRLARPAEGAMEHGSDAATSAAADGAPQNTTASKAPTVASAERAGTANSRRGTTAGERKGLADGISAPARQTERVSDLSAAAAAPTATPAAPTAPPSRAAGVVAMEAATEPTRLKVVGSPPQIGAKVTLYEVAPGDTVTLTESIPSFLSSVVVTGAATRTMAPQATVKSVAPPAAARTDAVGAAPPEAQRAAETTSSAPAVAARGRTARIGTAITLHTIRWTDSATGNTLTLSGRMPEARLQEIRIRIERERAAAAAKRIP